MLNNPAGKVARHRRWPRSRRNGKFASAPVWFGLGLVAAGFAALAIVVAPDDVPLQLPPDFADEPDLFIEDGVVSQYRDDGSLRFRLRSRRITHFERGREGHDDIAELAQPFLELHGSDAPEPWQVRATSGELRTAPTGGEEQLNLRGEVVLRQQRGSDGFTEVRTSLLTLYPERQFAQTDQPVTIASEAGRASAAGLQANLQSGEMKLLSSASQRVAIVVDHLAPP